MRRTSWVAILLVIVIGAGVGIGAGLFLAKWTHIMRVTGTPWFGGGNPFGPKVYVKILMLGEDNTAKGRKDGNGLSDTLVVFAINMNTREIRGISIPRDTRVGIPGHGTCKINAAHVYGGPELTRKVVSDLLGVPIDYYLKTTTTGLRGMVDELGGVYMVVNEDMRYTDRRGGLHINLHASPNKQLLNGDQAEQYVRFRHDLHGDFGWEIKDGKRVPAGRVVRQQQFMQALANRVLAMPGNTERAEFLTNAYEKGYIVSDLNLWHWQKLADYFKDVTQQKIAMEVLPGSPQMVGKGSFVVPDMEKVPDVVECMLLFRGPAPGQEMAKVEVLNGCGIGGVAKSVADKLKDAGFEVTRTDNAESSNYDRC